MEATGPRGQVAARAAILPVLAVRLSAEGPDATRGGQRKLVRALTWIEAVILTVYGLILTAAGLLVQAGIIKAAANADHLALKWHAYLWDPWFLLWGILVLIALRRSRPAFPKITWWRPDPTGSTVQRAASNRLNGPSCRSRGPANPERGES